MDFAIHSLNNSSIYNLYLDRGQIQIDPNYQRMGDVWPESKRQLLIDSILNGFDIPKFYFHEFVPPKKVKGNTFKYAIIDGRQRLQAIWDFIENKFAIASDTLLVNDPTCDLSNMTYDDLTNSYPRVKARFDSKMLDVVCISTDELELIEDLFSRLNEAVPLNAAEKRNAFPGPLPALIRRLTRRPFFIKKLPFSNVRYRHFDLACKFLYLRQEMKPVDTKKIHLDAFVQNYAQSAEEEAKHLYMRTSVVLDSMAKIFTDADELLRSIGMVQLYFLLFQAIKLKQSDLVVRRRQLVKFETAREKNRANAEENIAAADFEMLEFDRLTQSPNDELAMDFRLKVLQKFLAQNS